ncbi:regulatory protein RecX [Rhodohalobacter halophilus]|uniref:regulatory protein RecX n=1 Tax=Rhodohalobacter halophilus TaxID=1812810 RepID=UPI00083F8E75|nr:regulatory protein RecX [Rhodohalobacter halophilus]
MKPNWKKETNEKRDISDKLPLKVTSISPQKKRADRFSLFNEKTFLIGISAQTLIDYKLKKGVELTPFLFEQLQQAEEYQKIKDTFYDYLSRRDHGSHELRQKGYRKGFSTEMMNEILNEFDQKGLLNDLDFARKFAADKAEFKQWGPKKIKSELLKKGIGKDHADKAVKDLTNNLDQHQICVDLLHKKKRRYMRETDPFKRKQKMYRYLAGKGFSGEVIKKAISLVKDSFDV